MRTETINVGCFGIVLTITYDDDNGGRPDSGSIVSDLHEDFEGRVMDFNDISYDAAMHGIESLVLAQAMAEIDVTQQGFIEAIDTAVTAAAGNFC